jgi:hypothetical protein
VRDSCGISGTGETLYVQSTRWLTARPAESEHPEEEIIHSFVIETLKTRLTDLVNFTLSVSLLQLDSDVTLQNLFLEMKYFV